MAKKSRRARKKGSPIRLSEAQMVQPGGTNGAASVIAHAPVALQESDLREEYHYVVADLARIGIIALVMLAVLIVLALLLT